MCRTDPPTVLFWELEQALASNDTARAQRARAALCRRGFIVISATPPPGAFLPTFDTQPAAPSNAPFLPAFSAPAAPAGQEASR
ncbi:MAG: hypothetical protein ABSE73_16610 [Planctomycetota bacterium]